MVILIMMGKIIVTIQSPLFEKEGLGEIIYLNPPQSPSIPLFQRGK